MWINGEDLPGSGAILARWWCWVGGAASVLSLHKSVERPQRQALWVDEASGPGFPAQIPFLQSWWHLQ